MAGVIPQDIDIYNPGHLKIALLCRGMTFDERLRSHLGTVYQEKIYSYVITDWVKHKVAFPSEIRLMHKTYVGFHYRATSDYALSLCSDESPAIFINGRPIMRASLIFRPQFYTRSVSGRPMSAVGCSCANHGISFFIRDYCFYFNRDEHCRFCSLGPTQANFNDTLKLKRLHEVTETMKAIIECGDRIDFIQLSGGSIANHNKEVETYLPYIAALRKITDDHPRYRGTPIHLTSMPPHNLDLLDRLAEAGLTTISFDIECPSQRYFEKYCPGKTRTYGYNNMREALRQAVKVFGRGNAFTICNSWTRAACVVHLVATSNSCGWRNADDKYLPSRSTNLKHRRWRTRPT